RKKQAAEFPSMPKWRVAYCNVLLGDALRKTGARDEAIAAYEEAIDGCKEAVRRKPSLAYLYYEVWGQALAGAGARKEAAAAWEQAVQVGAENAEVANEAAWFLVTAAQSPIQRPEMALQLAKKAVAAEPQNGNFWNTLGAASYRAGQWQETVAALEQAMQLRSGGDSGDWFFLAMALRQLGDAGKARPWHDRAIQWMDENRPHDQQLRRLRAEAAALFGIDAEPPKKQPAIGKQQFADKASMPKRAN